MLDIGWSEMAIIAVVALVVLGPKELPNALRTAAQWMRTARKLAREFQGGVDQIVREAELDEARKAVQQATKLNIGKEFEKTVDPTGETKRQLNEDPDKIIASSGAAKSIAGPAPAATTPTNASSGDTASSNPAGSSGDSAAAAPAASQPTSQPEPASAAPGENRA